MIRTKVNHQICLLCPHLRQANIKQVRDLNLEEKHLLIWKVLRSKVVKKIKKKIQILKNKQNQIRVELALKIKKRNKFKINNLHLHLIYHQN